MDLDGDGVTDAIRSSTRLECYFNDPEQGWKVGRLAERKSLDVFPNVDFADPRVKWADMTGDGLQDIVLVHDGSTGHRVDGDGAADLVYVDDNKVTLWINQSGNGWSQPITIPGTPAGAGLLG